MKIEQFFLRKGKIYWEISPRSLNFFRKYGKNLKQGEMHQCLRRDGRKALYFRATNRKESNQTFTSNFR